MTIDDILAIVGAKEVEIVSLRRRVAELEAEAKQEKAAQKTPHPSGAQHDNVSESAQEGAERRAKNRAAASLSE